MNYIYNTFLYEPLLNLLIVLYNIIPDLGVVIILLTVFIRLLLLPLFYKSSKDQTIIQKYVTPKIKEIQKKYKDNKEKQVQEMMATYREHKVSPFSSFFLILVQLPILITLYRLFLSDFSKSFADRLYPFISSPETIHTSFLGIINLESRNLVLVLLAVLFQYLQSKLLFTINNKKKEKGKEKRKEKNKQFEAMEKATKGMMLFGPFITFVILLQLPSAVALYWMTTSVFSTIQQIIINKQLENYGERSSKDTGKNDVSNGV